MKHNPISYFHEIRARLHRAGHPVQTPHEAYEAVWRLYQQHQSSREVSKIVGVSDTTIRNWLRKNNKPRISRGGARMVGAPVTLFGRRKLWREWFPPEDWPARERHTLYDRIVRRGWSVERALTEPILPRQFSRPRVSRTANTATAWSDHDDETYDN